MMRRLLVTETKLQFRDWGTVSFGLLFPAVLLVLLAFVYPGFRDPSEDLGGARPVDLYAPIVLVFSLVMVGISATANVLSTYRHDGILRRLRTTPVGPVRLLVAQLASGMVVALVGAALAVVAALVVLDITPPASWPATVAGLVLVATAMFALGTLVGALAPSPGAANGIAVVVWMPVMLLAGLWIPREGMPDAMRQVSDLSPGGAGVEAIQRAWFDGGVASSSLLVLVASTLVVGAVAAATFRWD